MNSKTNDICAFPVTPTNHSGQIADTQLCMTLRDYFEAKAVQAIITIDWYQKDSRSYNEIAEYIATDAYIIADAMLKERTK